jgi:small subunit ribosomal protein S13
MVYILGKNISDKKAVCIGLKSIYGIGDSRAKDLCKKVGLNPWMKLEEVGSNKIRDLVREIRTSYIIDVELKRFVQGAIRKEMDLRSYRGLRHRYSLPVNGQRTRSNARTAKHLLRKMQ